MQNKISSPSLIYLNNQTLWQ